MTDSTHQWREKDWERHVDALLSTHHAIFGESYQPVPDYKGDRGLEGFSNTGDSYQSYADQNSKTKEQCTEKQKKKIREDLKKLETYADFWADVLGDLKLKHWTLMVPNLEDKEVIKYARTKSRQLVKKGLSFIDDAFYADVKTAEQFPAAKAILRDPSLPKADVAEATAADVAAFQAAQPEFIRNLHRNQMGLSSGNTGS